MSSLAFLVTELQSLASETRRKHPEIREAAERSLAILRASPEQATLNLASDGSQSDDLLRPVFMGCATKNVKVVAISLGSLQRLISLKAVPHSAVPGIINTMSDAMNQGVDIQLRILQTLVSLIPNFPAIHGELLGDALLLCFKLQESKIAVVSSTAAATLRQLVMFVVDKMVIEDGDELEEDDLIAVKLPDGTSKPLGPSALDSFSVFEDLCLLANSERPHFLKLDSLLKTFALELIESVLTNYHGQFRKHPEFIILIQHHLCPLLLKALSDRPAFPLTLRCTRVVFLLLKEFSSELVTETEVFMMLLIRISSEDAESDHGSHPPRPPWMRVLAVEILRGLCSDAKFVRNVWDRYDGQGSGSNVFGSLVTALKRLITEKPVLLGVCSQLSGLGVSTESAPGSGYGLDVGGITGRVATAASATVSGVVGMMGASGGLSLQGSSMKLQCIDQLDKADSPPIPESYIYLLALQCITSLSDGLASFTGPLYNAIVIQKPRAAGEPIVRAPPALDINTLPTTEPSTKQLSIVRDIIECGWPALLAALSFIIATNLSDELFVEVLSSFQSLTNVSGMLGLTTPRDAFFASLAKFAVPARVVSSLETYVYEAQSPRSATTSISENLGLSGPVQAPGLSERNMACLKVLISSAVFLGGALGPRWFSILEVLQNADYVLLRSAQQAGGGVGGKRVSVSRVVSSAGGGGLSGAHTASIRHPLLSDLDAETLLLAMQRLFDASKNLEDSAYTHFVEALCRLSTEMVEMQSGGGEELGGEVVSREDLLSVPVSPKMLHSHRRRVSGIHIPRTLRSGDFGITKLGGVTLLNIHRLIYRSPDVAWDTTTVHLLSVIHTPYAPPNIRLQAAGVLDEILTIVPRNLSTTGELQVEGQKRVFEVLSKQVVPDPSAAAVNVGTNVEIRRMGLETLHQILQASGHTLIVGWETIFLMLESVCRPTALVRSSSVDSVSVASVTSNPPSPPVLQARLLSAGPGPTSEKGYTALVKIAFQSLTLVCDSVSSLSPTHLRLCISTLGQFGRQADTNIALTAATSLLWSVSDAIQSKRRNAEEEPQYSELWMFLLLELLGLCADPRQEVRDGAIQTLFRTVQLYGSTLSSDTWDQCIWKVTFPLLDVITGEMRHLAAVGSPTPDSPVPGPGQMQAWDDSKILALQSIGSIFHEFLAPKIMQLDSFLKAWDVFVTHIQDAVLLDNRTVSAPALRSLEKAVKVSPSLDLPPIVSEVLLRVWQAIDVLGGAVLQRAKPPHLEADGFHQPFTQECLIAMVDLIQTTRRASKATDPNEWRLERLTRLMAILKGVITYPNSPDFRPDVDALSPLQAVVIDTIENIDLSVAGLPSLVLRDLSEYITLAFLAAFDVEALPNSSTPPKRVTYISVSKTTMPMVVRLFTRFQDNLEVYVDGTMESVVSAYSIPVKLKYDCPAPSKFGKDPPLWKTATTSFLQIVKDCAFQIKAHGDNIPADRIEGLWHQILDVFRGGILADCSVIESFPLEVQEAEENFDLALIAALEIDVTPHLGDANVPDHLVSQLSKILQKGSLLYTNNVTLNGASRPSSPAGRSENIDVRLELELGSTELGTPLPRERFSYWCFDLLFLICSRTTHDQHKSRRRLAALSLTSLLARCRTAMVSYVADEALRGNLPFPRVRETELVYILRKLLELRLWPGSFWAALSDDPTKYAEEQPAIDIHISPGLLMADAAKRSAIAHLFHFYPVLCEIASIPRKTPSAWTHVPQPRQQAAEDQGGPLAPGDGEAENGTAVELDARTLARACLKEIGKEMGVHK